MMDQELDQDKIDNTTPSSFGYDLTCLIDQTANHLYTWCVTCRNLLFIQYDTKNRLCIPEWPEKTPSSTPNSILLAVSCRNCLKLQVSRKSSHSSYTTTLNLGSSLVRQSHLYDNLTKLAGRSTGIYILEHERRIIVIPMDKLSKYLPSDSRALGLRPAIMERAARKEEMLEPFVPAGHI